MCSLQGDSEGTQQPETCGDDEHLFSNKEVSCTDCGMQCNVLRGRCRRHGGCEILQGASGEKMCVCQRGESEEQESVVTSYVVRGFTCCVCRNPNHRSKNCMQSNEKHTTNKRNRESLETPIFADVNTENDDVNTENDDVNTENDDVSFLGSMGHLVWNGAEFEPKKPARVPTRVVEVRVLNEEQTKLTGKTTTNTCIANVPAFMDTCAQTCVSDSSILRHLCIEESRLIPTTHKIVAVTKDPLNIKGIVLIEISLDNRRSNQSLYITDSVRGLFITMDAQIDLGILPPTYPGCFQRTDLLTLSETNSCGITLEQNRLSSETCCKVGVQKKTPTFPASPIILQF